MRTLVIAGLTMVTAIAATPAAAQHALSNGQVWRDGRIMPPATVSPNPLPAQRGPQSMPPLPGYPRVQPAQHQQHWGGSVGGRWYGGSNAPGGWNAYRRPSRGWTLPRYWIAPSFFIADYGIYGLSTPPRGYSWTRYYDDAVLIDARGRVWDSVDGIDWDSYDSGYGYAAGDGGYAEASGGGGGYAGYGAGYAPPPAQYAPPPVQYQPAPAYPSPSTQGGYTTTYSTGGYVSGGYWYPPATTTTVTVQSAPVVTTTTTEYIEDRYTTRRVYRASKRKWHPKARRTCTCTCACR